MGAIVCIMKTNYTQHWKKGNQKFQSKNKVNTVLSDSTAEGIYLV